MAITGRENIKRFLKKEKPEYIGLRSDCMNFAPRICPENIVRAWVVEKNKYEGPVGGKDMFGVEWEYVPSAGGSMVKPGNPMLDDLENWQDYITFPDIEEWDWAGSAEENNEWLEESGKFVEFWIFNGLFERMIAFLDFENAAVALIDEDQEEDVHSFMKAMADFYCKIIRNVAKYFPAVDCIYFHDDWGAQKAPFFSVDTNRKMIAPYMKQIVDCCHENGLYFDLHSCGKTEAMTPVMIECGVDMWCGQPMNDKINLIKTYGDQIFIGMHEPFSGPGAQPIPESDEELYAALEEYLAPVKDTVLEKPFYVANMSPDSRVIQAYKDITAPWFK